MYFDYKIQEDLNNIPNLLDTFGDQVTDLQYKRVGHPTTTTTIVTTTTTTVYGTTTTTRS